MLDHHNEPRYAEVAQRMQLYHMNPSAAGVVYWKPSGLLMYEKLRSFIRAMHRQHMYQEVKSPHIAGLDVFAKSGHLAKYKDYLFLLNQANNEDVQADVQGYALRPMSCPNHIELYKSELRSYRDLPVRFFEFGEVFRNEPSGSLQSLFRMRSFCQDDSHVFAAAGQVVDVLAEYLRMSQEAYKMLGFEQIQYRVALRPEQRFGDDAAWDKAENALREACSMNGLSWEEEAGGGAFYGPKLELHVKDKLNRSWQLGVIQLDYVLPERFDLHFINEQGQQERPVLLHHAVLGSLERMLGILLESFGVELPMFIHPHEAVVVPVSNKALGYGKQCHKQVVAQYPDALLDSSDEPLGAKLRYWKQRGIPNILVVGEKEQAQFEGGGEMRVALNSQSVLLQEWLSKV